MPSCESIEQASELNCPCGWRKFDGVFCYKIDYHEFTHNSNPLYRCYLNDSFKRRAEQTYTTSCSSIIEQTHGIQEDGNDLCTCNTGYAGNTCQLCDTGYVGDSCQYTRANRCNNHGDPRADRPWYCDCDSDSGRYGRYCEYTDEP